MFVLKMLMLSLMILSFLAISSITFFFSFLLTHICANLTSVNGSCNIFKMNKTDTAMQLYMYIETSFWFLVQRSVIEQPFLSYRDIKPGELVKVRWLSALEGFLSFFVRGLFSFPPSPLLWRYLSFTWRLLANVKHQKGRVCIMPQQLDRNHCLHIIFFSWRFGFIFLWKKIVS